MQSTHDDAFSHTHVVARSLSLQARHRYSIVMYTMNSEKPVWSVQTYNTSPAYMMKKKSGLSLTHSHSFFFLLSPDDRCVLWHEAVQSRRQELQSRDLGQPTDTHRDTNTWSSVALNDLRPLSHSHSLRSVLCVCVMLLVFSRILPVKRSSTV